MIDSIETKDGKKIDNKDIIDGAHTKSKVNVSKKRVDSQPKDIDRSKKLSLQTDYLSARKIKLVNTTYGRKLKGSEILDGAYVKKGVFADGGAIDKFNWKSFTLVELMAVLPDDVKLAFLSTPEKIDINFSDVKEIKPFLKTKWTISDYANIGLKKGAENIYLDIVVYDLGSKSDLENKITIYTKENHQGLKDLAASLVQKFKNGGQIERYKDTKVEIRPASKTSKKFIVWDVKSNQIFANEKFDSIDDAKEFIEQNKMILTEIRKFSDGGSTSDNHNYMMLSRLQSDCDYYLGFGNRNPKVLWAGNEEEHIAEMKKIYNELPEKPEWLTMKQIEDYESKMKSTDSAFAKGGLTEHGLKNGDKIYDTFAPDIFPNEVIVNDQNNKKHFVNLDTGTRGQAFANGGIVGQEIVFNHWSGDVKTGTIEEMHTNGEYIVQSGFGSMLVNPDDVISISAPKPEKKFLGIFENGGKLKWSDAKIGDSARVIEENKMGLIIKDYGRKFHLRFPDGTEKTYDASNLEFYKLGDDEFGDGGVVNSTLLTDEENDLTNGILEHPLFKDYKEIETFSSGGNNFHTCILLSNGHIVTINYDSGVIQYSHFVYDSISEYLEESFDGMRGWDNESYTPDVEMNMIYIEDGYGKFFDSKLSK